MDSGTDAAQRTDRSVGLPRRGFRRMPILRVPGVLSATLRGLVRRMLEKGHPPNEALAMEYFRERSRRKRYREFLDSSSPWYLSPLLATEAIVELLGPERRPIAILDVGCGRGGLCRWLKARAQSELQYTGVDQDALVIAHCEKTLGDCGTFRCGDSRNLEAPALSADVIFTINMFPYIIDPIPILTRFRTILRPRGFLVVLDPADSSFWKHELPGFGVSLRSASTWTSLAAKAGWRVEEIASLGVFAIGTRAVLPLSNVFVLTPETQTPMG